MEFGGVFGHSSVSCSQGYSCKSLQFSVLYERNQIWSDTTSNHMNIRGRSDKYLA